MKTYTNPVYAYRRSAGPGRRRRRDARWSSSAPGRSGSPRRSTSRSAASPVVVLDDDDTVSVGSRAICYAKRTLEILDRLGCGERVVQQGRRAGTSARSSIGDELVYQFDLLPEPGHRRPAFVNLQQYYLEEFLVERVAELPAAEMRWQNKVVGVRAAAATASR